MRVNKKEKPEQNVRASEFRPSKPISKLLLLLISQTWDDYLPGGYAK